MKNVQVNRKVASAALAALILSGSLGLANAEARERGSPSEIASILARHANFSSVDQRGERNRAATVQNGAGNASAISQNGADQTASVRQTGNANTGTVRQFGRGNNAAIAQNGDNNNACVIQFGRNLNTQVVQNGDNQSRGVVQTRTGSHDVSARACDAHSPLMIVGTALYGR